MPETLLDDDTIDADTGRELTVRQATGPLTVTPAVDAADLVARMDVIREAMTTAMQPDVDYGVIPGTGTKPTLLKPGAEKLGVLFQLDVQIDNEKLWGPGDHLTVMSQATVFHAPTGTRLGFGEGLCTTREKKYGKRRQERKCPTCGAAAVIKGKKEYGGGWVCWKKRDGCGAAFSEGNPQIEGQDTGDVDNPDLADTWNTVVKMAEKRARVDAILAVTGASALFTQDVESEPGDVPSPPADTTMPATTPGITPDQYTRIVALFREAGSDTEAFHAQLDTVGAPENEQASSRVSLLSREQATTLIELLDPLAGDVPL